MHSTSLYTRYPRSPFKFLAFINALLFLCHTSGLKLFPGGSVLLRPSSNAGLEHLQERLLGELDLAGVAIRPEEDGVGDHAGLVAQLQEK